MGCLLSSDVFADCPERIQATCRQESGCSLVAWRSEFEKGPLISWDRQTHVWQCNKPKPVTVLLTNSSGIKFSYKAVWQWRIANPTAYLTHYISWRRPAPRFKQQTHRYAPHNVVSVNDGPHIRRWFHKISIL